MSITNDAVDFLVIGGGSAGCVVASRLSENPDTSLLCIGIALGALADGAVIDAHGVVMTFLIAAAVSAVAISVFGSAERRSAETLNSL